MRTMKKIIAAFFAAFLVSSCLDLPYDNLHSKRTAYEIGSFSKNLCVPATLYSTVAVKGALHLNAYLKEDDAGKKESKYNDIIPESDGKFTIESFGTFDTGGRNLDEEGVLWKLKRLPHNYINPAEFIYEISAGEGYWSVNGTLSEDKSAVSVFIDASSISFLTKVSVNASEESCWTVSFTGNYEEGKDEFRSSFKSEGELSVKEITTPSYSMLQFYTTTDLKITGNASVTLYKGNDILDWCKLAFRSGDCTTTTSQDNS